MPNRRIYLTIIVFFCIFTGLMANVFYLQIVKGQRLAREAAAMRDTRIELSEFPRGQILDRNLLPLTGTVSSNAVYCLPGVIAKTDSKRDLGNEYRAAQLKKTARFLADVIPDLNSGDVYNDLDKAATSKIPYLRIKSDLSSEQTERINSSGISGLVVAPIAKRYEPRGFCTHLIGYVGGSNEGKAGLEKLYDDILIQKNSSQQLVSVLDARGMAIRGLMFRLKNEQKDQVAVVLTIDKRVQRVVEEAMDARVKKGAVVVLNVKTREVIAMASRPDFSPYEVDKLIASDKQSSLINRALTPYYPGSLFKILIAAAALQEGVVDLNEKFMCTGQYEFNEDVSIPCWKEGGHGLLTFREALALSCNPTFIAVAERLGHRKILDYVQKLHITDESLAGYSYGYSGSGVQIDAGSPALGNACLGQHGVMLTPLQIASLIATIADGGKWLQPSLVRYYINKDGKVCYPSRKNSQQTVNSTTARQVQKLLELTVEEGTGKTAALQETAVAGKTATSETGSIKENQEQVLNTWFGGYFPAHKPEWAVVVLSEDGTSGAQNAAPVFKEIAQGILQSYPR
jgi:penicillin-binding protein 2